MAATPPTPLPLNAARHAADFDFAQVTLRSATDADVAFLKQLRRVTMHQVVTNHYPWDDDAQYQRVMSDYASARVISVEGQDIGLFKVVYSVSEVHLSQIQLLPNWQGRGLGAKLISSLQSECAKTGVPITLDVFRSNPALNLYLRLGFEITSSDPHAHRMRWSSEGKKR
jgi:ribosomal protein S18 acetylase RimI-like enzyme